MSDVESEKTIVITCPYRPSQGETSLCQFATDQTSFRVGSDLETCRQCQAHGVPSVNNPSIIALLKGAHTAALAMFRDGRNKPFLADNGDSPTFLKDTIYKIRTYGEDDIMLCKYLAWLQTNRGLTQADTLDVAVETSLDKVEVDEKDLQDHCKRNRI